MKKVKDWSAAALRVASGNPNAIPFFHTMADRSMEPEIQMGDVLRIDPRCNIAAGTRVCVDLRDGPLVFGTVSSFEPHGVNINSGGARCAVAYTEIRSIMGITAAVREFHARLATAHSCSSGLGRLGRIDPA